MNGGILKDLSEVLRSEASIEVKGKICFTLLETCIGSTSISLTSALALEVKLILPSSLFENGRKKVLTWFFDGRIVTGMMFYT